MEVSKRMGESVVSLKREGVNRKAPSGTCWTLYHATKLHGALRSSNKESFVRSSADKDSMMEGFENLPKKGWLLCFRCAMIDFMRFEIWVLCPFLAIPANPVLSDQGLHDLMAEVFVLFLCASPHPFSGDTKPVSQSARVHHC